MGSMLQILYFLPNFIHWPFFYLSLVFGVYVIFVKFVKLLDIEERKALCVRHQDDKAKGIHVSYNTTQPTV